MNHFAHAAIAAIAFACLSSAASTRAEDRISVTTHVRHGDLEIATAKGRAAFDRRLSIAARRACGVGNASQNQMPDAMRCYREMVADGAVQLAAIARPGVRIASAD